MSASAAAWTAFNGLYVVFLTVFAAMYVSRRRWPTQVIVFAVLIGLVTALKVATAVPRPDGSDRRSFPSGHAAAAFYVAGLAHYQPVVTLWAGIASLARVVLRRHTWLDVGVGATLGAMFGTFA